MVSHFIFNCGAIHQEVAREVNELVSLEAVETALRAALHQAEAAALSAKPVLTVVGRVRISRPYYLCAHCHQGQFPADLELDVEDTEVSPGVRRMLAMV